MAGGDDPDPSDRHSRVGQVTILIKLALFRPLIIANDLVIGWKEL